MSKKICVIGNGYVGLITAAGLADFGNKVIGADIDEKKIEDLNNKKPVIYEAGLEEYLSRNIDTKRLSFTTDLKLAIQSSEVIFIAVGTPSDETGEAELRFVFDAVDSIAAYANSDKIVVLKSTVPVGTNRIISEKLKKSCSHECTVVSNPEFLREGSAIYDFFHPDRVVIGFEDPIAEEVMEDVYRSLNRLSVPFVWCNWETAELIKYASNGFLAMKIAYVNQLADLSEAVGADITLVAKAMGMDGRIGPKFLHPGPGYGGSCFPKDTRALSMIGKKNNVPLTIIDSVIQANENHKFLVYQRLKKRMGSCKGKTIGVLGLTFKAETDDVRESSAIVIIEQLLKDGAIVQAHDPKGIPRFREYFDTIRYMNSAYDAAKGADALLVLTEWNEYRSLDLERIKQYMKNPYIFDTRNVIDVQELVKLGFKYDLIGKKTI